MPRAWQTQIASIAHRALALACALIVVALAVCAASPELHHKLHVGDTDAAVDTCAVAVFATGVSAAVAAIAIAAPSVRFVELAVRWPARVFVAAPRYLRQPERGPPALS